MKHLKKISLPIIAMMTLIACLNSASEKKENTSNGKDTVNTDVAPVTAIDSASRQGQDTVFREFAFVAGNQYIILSASPDSSWGKGEPHLVNSTDASVYASISDMTANELPVAYAGLLNKKARVYSADGTAHNAKITGFGLYAAYIPHFGQVQEWNEKKEDGTPAVSDKQKAKTIRESAGLFLVAKFELEQPLKGEEQLYFAVPEHAVAPVFATSAPKEISAPKKAIEPQLYKTTEYLDTQKEYLTSPDHKKGNWWADPEGEQSWALFKFPDESYVTVFHSAGNPCGDEFTAEKFSIWKLSKDVSPVRSYMNDGYCKVILMADLDGDHIPELIVDEGFGKQSLLKMKNGKWEQSYRFDVPYQDCPC